MQVLVDAIEQLSAARNFARIIDIVKRAARQIAAADGATVVLREGNLCYYVDEDAIGPLWKGHKFPMHSCISGWAMEHKSVVVVPDIYVDPRIPHDAYRPTFVKSLVMVPVRVDDPLASIGAYWAAHYVPSQGEIELLQSLARSTATAIANVNLEVSLREAATRAERAGDRGSARASRDEAGGPASGPGRGSAAPVAEDGGDRATDRRHRRMISTTC